MSEEKRLFGGGLLGQGADDWTQFLSELGRTKTVRGAFVARNFVLDEGVLTQRRDSYKSLASARDFGDIDSWEQAHNLYLKQAVFLDADDDGPPARLDPDDSAEIPETFRDVDADSPFLGTDPEAVLIRVEELTFLADSLGEDAENIRAALEINLPGAKRTPEAFKQLDDCLADWHRELDQRPVYSMFWEDVADLFPSKEPKEDSAGWADALRDRMGLLHLDPESRESEVDVLVFRYPLKDVPRILGTGGKRRPLVTPTVLDGKLSEAFCPSPRGSTTGHVVNLNPEAGQLRREVLHPRPRYRPHHLWRLGRLTRSAERGKLPDSRALHLLMCRDQHGRSDYAAGTNGDLLS